MAAVLKSIISMRLVPMKEGRGRVPAVEVLRSTPYIRDCVENKEKTKLIQAAIAAGTSQYSMQTFDQSLYNLFKADLISYEEALRQATNPDEFKLKVAGIQSASDMATEAMEAMLQQSGGGGSDSRDPHDPDSPFEFSNS
jgi:twitching motility protein PilT